MTCWNPIKGFLGPGGKVVSSRSKAVGGQNGAIPTTVPCGQCMGCRLDRSAEWSVRIAHEASCHEENCFVTLTYDDAHLPPGGNLVKADFQKFMKRLRKKVGQVRYFACGEYGDENHRPHYHAILFGWRPSDAELWRMSNQHPIWRSALLEKLWPFGFSEFGQVSPQSGGYVARYVLKKSTTNHDGRYNRFDPETGEVWSVDPEFMVCSSVPMIGWEWLEKYEGDCFPSGYLVVDGRKVPVPRAYIRKVLKGRNLCTLGFDDADRLKSKRARLKFDPERIANSTDERLAVRGEVQRLKMVRLSRKCEP